MIAGAFCPAYLERVGKRGFHPGPAVVGRRESVERVEWRVRRSRARIRRMVCDRQSDGKSRGWRSSAGSKVASGSPRTLEYERSAMSSSARNPAGSRKAENWSATMASYPTEMLNPARAEESALSCTACPHSMDSHDALGVRFCAVTSSRSLDRKCICSGEAQNVQHYNRY
ncbi:RGCVC family protein [Rhodococcus sp. NPDC060086]|uniref:RGCVC family protein n=1 Tax=Rhodococcus sp. NPDC060086 TaxID=3347055 RepID=UPI003658FF22